jgi:hypothetical protein
VIYDSRMQCPEKKDLQARCTAAWDAYAAEAERNGFSITRNGAIQYPSISEVMARAVDPAGRVPPANYASVIRLRGEHLTASRELSRHLTQHRCYSTILLT